MFLRDVIGGGEVPVLEWTARFAARRHELLAHNIANIDTPNFRPLDVSPAAFQEVLGDAIDRRRERGGVGRLEWRDTREIERRGSDLELMPRTPSGNILFHDRNDRDLERMMADLSENLAVFRMATDLLRSRYGLINGALAERV
jgi:flagellar basal-body rod protein FlgB